MPSVIKATAIVNGDVITQTDVDQRLALLAIANGSQIPADQVDALRQQVLQQPHRRNARNPGGQDREDRNQEVGHRPHGRSASPAASKQTPEQLAAYLESHGSSIASLRRQIEGEIAWQPAAAGQDRKRRQRRRRRGEGRPRPAQRFEGHRAISGRRDLPFVDALHAGSDAAECDQDSRPAEERRLVRGLCAAIFGSVDRGRRRRPRLGSSRATSGSARRLCCARWGRARSATRSRFRAEFRSSPSRTPARS